ncbi:MAG: hypothetical protein Q8P06_00765 [Candidatus Azambacteria bacterium]|nr:hypothetical protein [Candidatus Azambacteria bacterium]
MGISVGKGRGLAEKRKGELFSVPAIGTTIGVRWGPNNEHVDSEVEKVHMSDHGIAVLVQLKQVFISENEYKQLAGDSEWSIR